MSSSNPLGDPISKPNPTSKKQTTLFEVKKTGNKGIFTQQASKDMNPFAAYNIQTTVEIDSSISNTKVK